MKYNYVATCLLSFVVLFANTPKLGSQEVDGTSTYLQVEGKKDSAIQALKSKGIKAIELKGSPFLLPSVELVGAEDSEVGDMIQIKAVVDRSKLPEHLSTLKYQWTVFEDGKPKRNFIVWPDGTQIFFAAGMKPKKITVILDVDCLFEVKQAVKVVDPSGKVIEGAKVLGADGKVVTEVVSETEMNSPEPIVKEIQVGGVVPTPTPTPVPPNPVPPVPVPVPVPPLPDIDPGMFGLAKTTRDIVIASVPEANRTLAPKLAESYNKVADRITQSASKIAAGVALTAEDQKVDVNSIMAAIAASNKTTLGSSAGAWAQWNKLYGDEVYRLYTTKKIVVPADWAIAFRETAQGLSLIK